MAEIRETLRFNSTDLEEMNRVMGRLQDRLDALEGLRGQPAFHTDVDFKDKRLLNVSGMATEATEATPTVTSSTQSNFDLPVICQSTLEVDGALTAKSTARITGVLTANAAVFNGSVYFNGSSTSLPSTSIYLTKFTQAGTPTAAQITNSGGIALWDDTIGGFFLCANFGGVIKTVALT